MNSWVYLALAAFGLFAGVGITAVGPGGILATVGLFLLSGLSPAHVAGTAIVTHLATGTLGSAAYVRSGQLHQAHTRRIALILAITAAVGTPIGVLLNSLLPQKLFGFLLAAFIAAIAALVWLRSSRAPEPATDPHHPTALLIAGGLAVASVSGMFGVGGPLLTVPLLVAAGTPILSALAAAQVQSVIVAGVGTLTYAVHGSIDWRLALVVGLPELVGVLIGWKIAQASHPRHLRGAMIATLIAAAAVVGIQAAIR